MPFTEEDAENDGLIKREVGNQLNSVLSRKGGKLYQKFLNWCDEYDRDPAKELGDMALRCMRDDSFADAVSATAVDISKLQGGSVRQEDLEMVTELIEQLGVEDSGSNGTMDAIDKMIEQRIEAMGSGPLGGMTGQQGQNGQESGSGEQVQRLERRIQRIEQAVTDDGQQPSGGSANVSPDTSSQSTDDIFEEIEGGDGDVDNEVEGEEEQVVEDEEDDSEENEIHEIETAFSTEEADE